MIFGLSSVLAAATAGASLNEIALPHQAEFTVLAVLHGQFWAALDV
jgi:hypothetical protein